MKNSIPVGAALLFTVFTVIMLASFAGLALSSANADLAFTLRAENAMDEYYSLDKEAQYKLAEAEKNGESVSFTIEGDHSNLIVAAEMKNGRLEITEYRSVPVIDGDYEGGNLELWDGN
ncbi:MAG: hypothetical protein IKU13_03230 [Clostridia bacterium]|nr:hypothetical protein [Clostridia bacterium]MBR5265026.1 hypothetical protein [Clostridia bacterium]